MKERVPVLRLRCCLPALTTSVRPQGRNFIRYSDLRLPHCKKYSEGKIESLSNTVVHERLRELRESQDDMYPRITPENTSLSCRHFIQLYKNLLPDQTSEDEVVVRGKSRARPNDEHDSQR